MFHTGTVRPENTPDREHLPSMLIFSYSTMFKTSPPLSGESQKIHSIKCAKLLTSTVVQFENELGAINSLSSLLLTIFQLVTL